MGSSDSSGPQCVGLGLGRGMGIGGMDGKEEDEEGGSISELASVSLLSTALWPRKETRLSLVAVSMSRVS